MNRETLKRLKISLYCIGTVFFILLIVGGMLGSMQSYDGEGIDISSGWQLSYGDEIIDNYVLASLCLRFFVL